MFEKCHEIYLKYHSSNDIEIAESLNNISQVCHALRNYSRAIDCLKQALTIQLHSLLPNDLNLSTTYHNLTEAYFRQRKLFKALDNARLQHTIDSKHFTHDHPRSRDSLNRVAILEILLWYEKTKN